MKGLIVHVVTSQTLNKKKLKGLHHGCFFESRWCLNLKTLSSFTKGKANDNKF